jgi:hypothetical protein
LAAKKTDEKEQTKRRSEGRGNRELLLVDRWLMRVLTWIWSAPCDVATCELQRPFCGLLGCLGASSSFRTPLIPSNSPSRHQPRRQGAPSGGGRATAQAGHRCLLLHCGAGFSSTAISSHPCLCSFLPPSVRATRVLDPSRHRKFAAASVSRQHCAATPTTGVNARESDPKFGWLVTLLWCWITPARTLEHTRDGTAESTVSVYCHFGSWAPWSLIFEFIKDWYFKVLKKFEKNYALR